MERVRFNPHIVERMDPNNGFRLIFPGQDDEYKYDKFLRKAHEIWSVTTGTQRAGDIKNSS